MPSYRYQIHLRAGPAWHTPFPGHFGPCRAYPVQGLRTTDPRFETRLQSPIVPDSSGTAISTGSPREYPGSDNDPLFLHHHWQAKLRIPGADEIKTVAYTPLSHPFVDRAIGTTRREHLAQAPFWNAGESALTGGSLPVVYKLQTSGPCWTSHETALTRSHMPTGHRRNNKPRTCLRRLRPCRRRGP